MRAVFVGLGMCMAAGVCSAQLVIENGADIDMNGSVGSQIIFPDGTTMGSAAAAVVPTGHGGSANTLSGTHPFIGGGYNNTASATWSTIGGGALNEVTAYAATTGGGLQNKVTDRFGFVGGGNANQAGDNAGTVSDREHATVGGGLSNLASGTKSTVAGGDGNTASGARSTIGGGVANVASEDTAIVGGGLQNTASGIRSAVLGGYKNTASGTESVALGALANASHNNSFVFGDFSGGGSNGNNTFNVHASGGIYLDGVSVHSSDRDKKTDFEEADPVAVLEKLVELPVTTWRFKTEAEDVRHLGPTAQDFAERFGYGAETRYISSVDADGVAFAAIQGLNQKLIAKEEEIAALKARLERLEAMMDTRAAESIVD